MPESSLTSPLKKRFLVIAHRGASHYAPENTMAAFKMAYRMKADMIELDVQLSKDGVPVVFHDAKLDKHSNGKGLLSDFMYDELRQLDAGKWFSVEFMGEKIPSLETVLKWAASKILVNIEIKTVAVSNSPKYGVEEKVIQLVQNTGMEKHVIISSFDYRSIERIKKLNSKILTGLLYHKKSSAKRGLMQLLQETQADFFHCAKSEMTKKCRKELEDSEKQFLIYTVNRRKAMQKWIKKGAFGIFSDKPDLLRGVADDLLGKSA
ncbi:MAG: glycerophosphodiester phosphodiesterase family protein [Balneolaceae bacterium]|nr:glycerophosphodiester phosphodiesterase family protein [Balneolaceae bacterium]